MHGDVVSKYIDQLGLNPCSICKTETDRTYTGVSCCRAIYHTRCISKHLDTYMTCARCKKYCVTVQAINCLDTLDRNSLYLGIYKICPYDLALIDRMSDTGGRYYDIFHDTRTFRNRWRESTYGLFDGYDWCNTMVIGSSVYNLIVAQNMQPARCLKLIIYSPDYRKVRMQLFRLIEHLEMRVGEGGCFYIEKSAVIVHFKGLAMSFSISFQYRDIAECTDGATYDGNISKITVGRLISSEVERDIDTDSVIMSYAETIDSFGKRIGKCILPNTSLRDIYRDYTLTIECRPLKWCILDTIIGELRTIVDIKYISCNRSSTVACLCTVDDKIVLAAKHITKHTLRGFIMRYIQPKSTECMI